MIEWTKEEKVLVAGGVLFILIGVVLLPLIIQL